MISFLSAAAALIAGYFIYGRIVERNFGPDERQTPAVRNDDGVDYVPMPTWKVCLIQLLNIAGTGPIFGALSGALFGPIVYLWIVFGCIFAGAVHDFYCGMISVRNNGAGISELAGHYLGNTMRQIMRVFSVILLVMCGVVFTTGPAGLLDILTKGKIGSNIWLLIIIIYYFTATFLPIDKVIGKLYPVFGICLIIMAIGVASSIMFSGRFTMPELWDNFYNQHCNELPVWPYMFVTVACGAVSGFHATQSPMMARCIKSEKDGRKVFYGAMIGEGVIALVWAAAGVTCYESSQALLEAGAGCSGVVYSICQSTMGRVGGILAMIGVIVCPISSGDTAYRSARLTLAEWFRLDQSKIKNRLIITIPLLAAGCIICGLDYNAVWRYFSWANQTLAMIALWSFAVYLKKNGRNYHITAVPAAFMTAVSVTYFITAPECLGLLWSRAGITAGIYYPVSVCVGTACAVCLYGIMIKYGKKKEKSKNNNLAGIILLIAGSGITGYVVASLGLSDIPDDAGMLQSVCALYLHLMLMLLAFYLQVIVHEGGHLIAGLLTGYRFSSFRIGRVMLLKTSKGLSFRRFSLAGTGGQCLLIPPEKAADGRYSYKLYHLGGVLLNLITAALFFILYLNCKDNSAAAAFLCYLSVSGLICAVQNGIPVRMNGIATDGYNVLHIGKDAYSLEAMWRQLKINEALTEGIRLKELPDEWFCIPENAPEDNEIINAIAVFSENRAMDARNFNEAKKILAILEEKNYALIGLHKNLLMMDRVTIDLIENGNAADVFGLSTQEMKKFRKTMAESPTVLRTEYAICLLKDGDASAAEKIRAKFRAISRSYPSSADIESENELMDCIVSVSEKGVIPAHAEDADLTDKTDI